MFVGRDRELALFTRLLGERAGSLLFLTGQAGTGKSSLLRQYERLCLEGAHPVALIDGAELADQSPEHRKRLELKLATGFGPGGRSRPPRPPRPPQPRPVLLIDGFEALGRLQEWLLTHLVPRLSRHALLVFASRCPAPTGLLLDAGWTSLLTQHELSPIADLEAHALLRLLEVPLRAQAAIVDFAAGYPLALTLAAQVMRRSSRDTFTPGDLRELQRLLVQVLCPDSVSGLQRLGLDICAIARITTPELIEYAIDPQQNVPGEQAQELFDWLVRQSFMERTAMGLRPHLLARLALLARARQERPRKYNALNRSVREFCVEELGSGAIAESGLTDLFFLDRETPLVRRLGTPDRDGEETPLEGAHETDHAGIVELISVLEGRRAGEIAAARLQLEPQAFEIVRGDPVEGVLHVTRLAGGTSKAGILATHDPVAPMVARFVAEHPLQDNDEATFFRWFVDRRQYQTPSKRVFAITARQTQIIMSTKRVIYSLCVYRNPQDWAPLFQTTGVPWEIVGRFELEGHQYALLAFFLRERSLKDLLVNAWDLQSSEAAATPPSPNAAEETRIKVRQRVADLGRKVQLTPREHEILELLSLGGTPGEIAARLRIRPRTVKFHCENLIRKAGVTSRGDLFRLLL